ncbi:hydrogenase maturation protease [Streptomyces laurentii]|uniref:Hydrogenase maturation protease n=1 Tax=Streptomyces laurentii TaxID=39478 RepID=A0A160P9X5_STRLU|nr:hydrogenase maturation protease [Streptomyces laurentii]
MAVPTRITVVGVGNEFRRDDGLGPAVITRLKEGRATRPLPPGTVLASSDGDPGRLIGLWEEAGLAVVVDAAHVHPGCPGRVHRLELGEHGVRRPGAASTHGLGLGEAVELSRVLGRLPAHLIVYAVESGDGSLGTGLTKAVAAVVEPLARRIEKDIAEYHAAVPPKRHRR